MKKNTEKNYLKLGLIVLLTVLATILICNLFKNYNKNKINSSYISKYVSSIQYDELKSAILEFSSNTFVYISYTGDKDIYNMEKELKKIVVKNKLEENFIYVDATDLTKKDDYLKNVNNLISNGSNKITSLPAIIYFKDNMPVERIDSGNGLLQAGQFEQLLEKYELIYEA